MDVNTEFSDIGAMPSPTVQILDKRAKELSVDKLSARINCSQDTPRSLTALRCLRHSRGETVDAIPRRTCVYVHLCGVRPAKSRPSTGILERPQKASISDFRLSNMLGATLRGVAHSGVDLAVIG